MKRVILTGLLLVIFGYLAYGQSSASGGTGSGLPSGCTGTIGNITCASFSTSTGTGVAGAYSFGQGTLPSTVSGSVQVTAPGSVTAYNLLLPSSASTGFLSCVASGGNLATCSFSAGAASNYYTSTTGSGIGPTSFTPASTCTLCILDSTASTGLTRLWLGYDAGGSFTTGHISPTKTNLSIVSGTTTTGTVQTDDAISFYTATGSYRGGILTNASGNTFYIGAGTGVSMTLGAVGGARVQVNNNGLFTQPSATVGIGALLVSTAAITGPVPVKADTANANQVVVTTTTDTGAGIVLGVCQNSPVIAANCNTITTGVATLTLGTGTCSIGQFVIVDTTTNGRAQCTGTYTAGTVIGVAMSAQSTVGSVFNVMVGLR